MTPNTSLRPSHGSANTPNRPPPRSGSPASLYSTYSYYQFDSAAPSPTDGAFPDAPLDPSAFTSKPRAAPTPPIRFPQPSTPNANPPAKSGRQTPQEYLQLGIQHHEANRLTESALCFEKSAKEDGGCGVGMLMWGLTLRHGWGCEKNEKIGFKWLSRAAESAVGDLEHARIGATVDSAVVQTELVLAIYEVGQCFFQGWGVVKDQKMAVSYYTVAARLGDPDAQSDLAFCLANGKGCKKDRKEAAKWYRAAVAQGQSDIGLAWIYKEKFQ
ncbi:HCP-like protein [Lyophyllum atratum]|nr:HCP-like protein [Lyophyllum atratum]